ncbi:hypothetical protein LX32DRAFT_651137 [Colletotrichum zoysiae]|uniref:Uncharacterized protein n=1 Tax=Colletotrichum zoysiae TaxID=1216348 RepID=A0AAD9HKV7_9PEZI|nr:hypothetical protein LX32DRAFT_651137 [Colletotrichum zoysiae]
MVGSGSFCPVWEVESLCRSEIAPSPGTRAQRHNDSPSPSGHSPPGPSGEDDGTGPVNTPARCQKHLLRDEKKKKKKKKKKKRNGRRHVNARTSHVSDRPLE